MAESTAPIDRWRRVAGRFGAVVDGVPLEKWDAPSPCEGWAARDVVGHLVAWIPPFIAAGTGADQIALPPAADDPADAWHALATRIGDLLADHGDSAFSHPQAGDHRLDEAVDRFVTTDVLVHTWDLAVATGQEPGIDPLLAGDAAAGMEPITDMLVASGHYGDPVSVAADADPITKLIALTGRDPAWSPRD